jgi:hypothetical protein
LTPGDDPAWRRPARQQVAAPAHQQQGNQAMSDTRYSGPSGNPASETPRHAPQEGIGPNPTTREGAVQPRVTDRHAPMPERPLGATAARQGATTGTVRWVLVVSIALAIIAMIVAWLVI